MIPGCMDAAQMRLSQELAGRVHCQLALRGLIALLNAQFTCSTSQPFPRPDPHGLRSRRAQMRSRMGAPVPTEGRVLDGFERDGTLGRVGMTKSEARDKTVPHRIAHPDKHDRHYGSCRHGHTAPRLMLAPLYPR